MIDSERQLRARIAQMFPAPKENDSANNIPAESLDQAGQAFAMGYHSALKATKEEIPSLFENVDSYKVGFMLEGAGMALTILDEMNNSTEKYLAVLFSSKSIPELKLCAVGVGWASARLSKPISWIPESIHEAFGPAVFNGYGFHQGFFKSDDFHSAPFFPVPDQCQEEFDTGLGRALWFNHEGAVEPIAAIINKQTSIRQGSLWKGIGVACAFNKSSDEKKTILKKLAGPNEAALIAGFEFAKNLSNHLVPASKI